MKVFVPNISEQRIGGGWTFLRNLKKGLAGKVDFVDSVDECDVLLITSASMVEAETAERALELNRGIVFRVDNVLKKSRNKRGRIYDKMKRFGQIADIVIYQSEWARDYAGALVGGEGSIVIYNGVDTSIFNPIGRVAFTGEKYLFVQYNRDENKRFPEAAYHFHQIFKQNKEAELTLVGMFSPELVAAEFDFFANERINFIPVIEDPLLMAQVYKTHDVLLFPAFADASPNTVLEARACGMQIELVNEVGGTKELLELKDISLERMCREYLGILTLAAQKPL